MDSYLKCWKTKSGKINYSLIGENSETLYTCVQGFERNAGLEKNIRAIAKFFMVKNLSIDVLWVKSPRANTVIKTTIITI